MEQGHRKRVIVLGAAGFVGRHVCRTLAGQGIEVIGLGHGSWERSEWLSWGLRDWVRADINSDSLNDPRLAGPFSSIIHCAGSGSVSYSYNHPLEDYQRAVETTAAVLEWTRLTGTPRCRVVLVSSAAVYGDQGDVDLIETATRSPVSPYGFHKLIAEQMCDSYSRFFGLHVSIVRLFSVYGEGLRKQLLWDAANKFKRHETRFFGTGHEMRDWLHVSDAAVLLSAAAIEDGQASFELYNGGGTQATTGHVLTELGTLFENTSLPVFTGDTHVGNPRRLTSDSCHARRQLGWEPRVRLSDGLADYARWFHDFGDSAA